MLTPNTDASTTNHAYIFMIHNVGSEWVVNYFEDVSFALMKNIAVKKLTTGEDTDLYLLDKIQKVAFFRKRYNPGTTGPYIVKSEHPMTPKELLIYIKNLSKNERKFFLQEAEL